MLQTNDKVLKVTRRKEIIKIRAEIYKKTIEKINKAKSQFFENVNEIKAQKDKQRKKSYIVLPV